MNKRKSKCVANKRPKLNGTTIIAVFLLVILSFNGTKSDDLCEAIVVDAITQLANGSIVIFRERDVWFVDQKKNELIGPCPISNVFKDMSGPVAAALTITDHSTAIQDFVGSSVYFENQNFYTFKNLKQFAVEWAAIIYLPHKGKQQDMGSEDVRTQKYMKQIISYAYFDPIDHKSKLVFSDGTLLSFTFDMSSQFEGLNITTIKEELNKYGVQQIPRTLTAALPLTKEKVSELFLFNGSTYCSIKMSKKPENQSCHLKAIKEFLNCDSIKRTNEYCLGDTKPKHEKPIAAEVTPKVDSPVRERNPEIPESKVQIRSDDQSAPKKSADSFSGSQSLPTNSVFALTFVWLTIDLYLFCY